jgi:hypothetical protein
VPRYYSNTAVEATLAAPVSASATSIIVSSTSGFPILYPYRLTLDFESPGAEVVDVTAGSGTNLTVVRGVDGTSAQTHPTGAIVAHTATAQDFRDSQDHIAATTAVHGLAPGVAVAGLSSTQTLTNKTIDGTANTLKNIDAGAVTGIFKSTTVAATGAATVGLNVKGFAGQTANLQNWSNSAGTVLAFVEADGDATFDSITTTDGGIATAAAGGSTFLGKSLDLTALLTTAIPLKVKVAAAATADALQVLTSAAVAVFKVSPTGAVTASGGITTAGGVTAATKSSLTQAVIVQTGATDPVLQLKAGAVATTKPYLQITNHADAALSKIDELGYWVGPADAVSLALTTAVPSNQAVSTKVNYVAGNAEFDPRDHQLAASPSRITIAVPGLYLVSHQAIFAINATGQRGSDVRLNSGGFPLMTRMNAVGGGYVTSPGSTRLIKLAANDYLEHWVYQNTSPAVSLSTQRHMQCTFMGTG